VRVFHVLNLGVGVQSTTIYLMILDGELDIQLDAAVFSDVGEEPASVYRHLDWLRTLGGPPIVTVSVGKLGDDLMNGRKSLASRVASIPCYTTAKEGRADGMVQRQCTKEYKIEPIERWIRRELVGLEPRQRMPADVTVHQYMGFSRDEPGRAARARLRFAQVRWGEVHFPLFDEGMTRLDCVRYLENRVPHEVDQSACVFCPFKGNRQWRRLRDNDPAGWQRAVEVDAALRKPGNICNRGLDQRLYVHRSCVPLDEADLGDNQGELFDVECEGGCGL
jgi:hypothetical protein